MSRDWDIPERDVTPAGVYSSRRQVLKALGFTGAGVAALGAGAWWQGYFTPAEVAQPAIPPDVLARYPARRDPRYAAARDRDITPRQTAASYNNFYELSTDKEEVARMARGFETRPWAVEVTGLCRKPRTFDLDDLVKTMPLQERVYRFRCVEAWSMVVPWTGFVLRALLDRVEPASDARFVRFVSFDRPLQAPGQRSQPWYPWPYHEALRMDEARSELTLLATGIYGDPLPKQHGAPVRLVVPWKYGYKSAKSITRIELVRDRPTTFWRTIEPGEYGFYSNVDPTTPHPRWSQATERDIATGERQRTLPYNGYHAQVARLYPRGASHRR